MSGMTARTTRTLAHVIESVATSDGAGVKLRRSLGSSQTLRHDPFLMLDEFYSDNPDDYLAGFPSHPHRGFETVTYMLDGHMQHKDNFGNTGDLGPGDVQWMTAAHGIIHSEMPQQSEGRMRGFQLWLNLPAKEKMKPASYRDIPAREIPVVKLAGGGEAHVIAGFKTRLIALALAGFSLASAVIFHSNLADQTMFIMFFKNVSMAGGFLIIAANGPGAFSLDRKFSK